MGITASPLPCLVAGDAGQRFALDPRPALFKRLLKQLCQSAEDGLDRLPRLEAVSRRSAAAIAGELRPGKLLERAARFGIVIETSGRQSWRSYVAPDVAATLGLVLPDWGRPKSSPPPSPALSAVLTDFDREMAAIERKTSGFIPPDPPQAD